MFLHVRLSPAAGRRRHPLALLSLVVFAAAASTAAAEPPRRDTARVHRVEPGETVWRIARRYGSSVESIMTRNGLRDVRRVRAGSTLAIPVEKGAARVAVPAVPAIPAAPQAAEKATEALRLETLLPELEQAIREARFEEALARIEQADEQRGSQRDPASRPRAARLEVLAATAEIAFGRREAALAHLARALSVHPELSLDPEATSPKLLSVFHAARILAAR